MGWWKIKDDSGRIAWDLSRDEVARLPERYNGDEPADILGQAFDRVAAAFLDDWERLPSIDELTAAVNFVLGPHREAGSYESRREEVEQILSGDYESEESEEDEEDESELPL